MGRWKKFRITRTAKWHKKLTKTIKGNNMQAATEAIGQRADLSGAKTISGQKATSRMSRQAVEATHNGNGHGNNYRAAIALIEAYVWPEFPKED